MEKLLLLSKCRWNSRQLISASKSYCYGTLAPNTNHYDAIISGGGMVGFAMACSLGKSDYFCNKKVLLVESEKKKVFKFDPEFYSMRVCAINPGSKSLLQKLGAWKHIENVRFSPVNKMQIWDAASDATITFGKADLSENLAFIVENDLILDALTVEAETTLKDRIDIIYGSKITNYMLPETENITAQMTLDNGSQLTADLIIGADGYNSGLRRAINTQYISYDYDQMAVVATLRISETGGNVTAWQRFLPTGPIALLPLSNDQSSLVWSTDKETAKSLLSLSSEVFTDRINQALWGDSDKNLAASNVSERVFQMLKVCNVNVAQENQDESSVRQLPPSVVQLQSRPAAFPLALGHAVDYVSPGRAVLIGDAAHRVHPLAGQGVNLGFGDVEELTRVIEDAISGGSDIGSLLYLKKYQSARQRHNLPVMGAIHGLHLLYGTTWTPLVMLRSIGFNVFDAIPSVKRLIRKTASV